MPLPNIDKLSSSESFQELPDDQKRAVFERYMFNLRKEDRYKALNTERRRIVDAHVAERLGPVRAEPVQDTFEARTVFPPEWQAERFEPNAPPGIDPNMPPTEYQGLSEEELWFTSRERKEGQKSLVLRGLKNYLNTAILRDLERARPSSLMVEGLVMHSLMTDDLKEFDEKWIKEYPTAKGITTEEDWESWRETRKLAPGPA